MADMVAQESPPDRRSALQAKKDKITKDINESEAYFTTAYAGKTTATTNRFYGVRDRNPNMPAWCSNMTMNLGFGLVHSETAQNIPGLYQPNQFFAINANDTKSEMGVKALQQAMYVMLPQMDFYTQHYWGIMDCLYTPAGWVKWGWIKTEKVKRTRKPKDGQAEKETKRKVISRAFCSALDVHDVLYDHKGYGVNDMRWWAHKYFVEVEDIRNLKDIYNEEAEVNMFLEKIDSMTILTRPTRVLVHEYWTDTNVQVMTENGFMLTDRDNTYDRIPARPIVKFAEPRKVMGTSMIEAGFDMIDSQDDLMNLTFDAVLLDTHKPFVFTGTMSDEDLARYPGKDIKLKPGQEYRQLITQPLGGDWINVGVKLSETLNKVLGNVDQVEDRGVDTATEARQIQARSNIGRRAFIDYNRENYLKWALEFWAEMIIDNLSNDEIVSMIGEKKAKDLRILKEKLSMKDLNYTITITGDNDTEDKMIYTQNVSTFLDMLLKIEKLKQTSAPVNFDVVTKSLINKYNLPDGTYVETDASKKKDGITLQQEIEVAAKGSNMTPEQYIAMLSQKAGKAPEAILAEIQQAGSLEAWMKAMAVAEQGISPTGGGQV
jgi:hypothetical protein